MVPSQLYRATVVDTPVSPFEGGEARYDADIALVVADGVIRFRGSFDEASRLHPDATVIDLREGVLLPGLVDTHVHFPQLRSMAGLGLPLLDWLDRYTLPEETRFADDAYAREVAPQFLTALAAAGTTSALVFGSHFAGAMHEFFAAASASGLRITSGLVVGDRMLLDGLYTTPDRARTEAAELIAAWHGNGRLRYAVTPRFSLSASDELLAACGDTFASRDDLWFTSHLNENLAEVDTVAGLFPDRRDYLDTYDHHGLVNRRSVYAHSVHTSVPELARMSEVGASVAHCPTSNSALGSGLFPLRRHLDAGVRVALGTDVGAGNGFSLFKDGIQAYFMQMLLGPEGVQLTPSHLLYLATLAGAEALGLDGDGGVGHLGVGMQFDAIHVRPAPGSAFDIVLSRSASAGDVLARTFALATTYDVAATWVGGDLVHARSSALGDEGASALTDPVPLHD